MIAVPDLRHLVRTTTGDFDAERTFAPDRASTAADEVDGNAEFEVWRLFSVRI
jgi:hypothetical protein